MWKPDLHERFRDPYIQARFRNRKGGSRRIRHFELGMAKVSWGLVSKGRCRIRTNVC